MTNKSNFFLTALFICITSFSMAMGGVTFTAEAQGGNRFVLTLQNPGKTTVEVLVKDVNGRTLQDNTYLQSGIQREYDLTGLPAGGYYMILKYDDLIEVQPITKTRDQLVIDHDEVETIAAPEIVLKGRSLNVTMDHLRGLSLFVKIEDDLGNVLYWKREEPSGLFQQQFDLSRLAGGRYHFSLALKGNVFVYRFSEVITLVPEVL